MFKSTVQYIQFRTHKGNIGRAAKYNLLAMLIKENTFFVLDGNALIEKTTLDPNEMLINSKPANKEHYEELLNRIKEKYPDISFLVRKTLSIKEISE